MAFSSYGDIESIAGKMSDGVVLIDGCGVVSYINAGARRILGLHGQVVGSDWRSLIASGDQKKNPGHVSRRRVHRRSRRTEQKINFCGSPALQRPELCLYMPGRKPQKSAHIRPEHRRRRRRRDGPARS